MPKWAVAYKSETELRLKLVTGATIWVTGMEKPERIEGSPWDGAVLDEYGNMKANVWGEHVRPALADRGGWCWFIGVPEGRNHYWDLYQRAQADTTGEWAAFTWTSEEILPAAEIAAMAADLDPLTYDQEARAQFVSFQGRAYYGFDELTHVRPLAYMPGAPLIICLDFNVSPGVAVVCQEQPLPSGEDGTGVIGEVWIPQHSTTPRVCAKLYEDWQSHAGPIIFYGDATGGATGSAKVAGSDWVLVRQYFEHTDWRGRLAFRVPGRNPAPRARMNVVNSRLKTMDGRIRLMVDGKRAPHVVTDFAGVRVLEGTAGELDKNTDPKLTHLTDAVGYYESYDFGRTRVEGADNRVSVTVTEGP